MADLTFKIDADTGGFLGAIKKAGTTIKDFGIIGGPPILAVKAAMAGVEGAAKLAATAVKGVGTAASSVAAGGKSMVALLNQVNGAVELMNKVLPALAFPLSMAENAERTKGAFEALKTSWGELAGSLGEGVNDALVPILKAAGVEIAKLKVQAKDIGQSIGDAIDLTRVSYQMGQLPELLWLNLQKVMLQWGDSIWKLIQDMGYGMAAAMEMAMSRAIIFWKENAWEWIGGDKAGAAKERETMQRTAAEYNQPRPDIIGGNQGRIDELTAQISALSDPMKARIIQEKEATKTAMASAEAFAAMNDAIQSGIGNLFGKGGGGGGGSGGGGFGGGSSGGGGGLIDRMEAAQDKMIRESLGMPAPRLTGGDPMALQGPGLGGGRGNSRGGGGDPDAFQGPLQPGQREPGTELLPAPSDGKATPTEKQRTPGRIKGAGFGKKDGPRLGLGYFNGQEMAGVTTPRLDAMKLARGATNKVGASGADKKEREAAQKDAKASSAIDTVLKTLPSIAIAMQSMQKDISQAQSR